MTSEQVLTKLSQMYSHFRQVKDNLFCAKVDGILTLFRVKNDTLEQRVDIDEHICKWEEVK